MFRDGEVLFGRRSADKLPLEHQVFTLRAYFVKMHSNGLIILMYEYHPHSLGNDKMLNKISIMENISVAVCSALILFSSHASANETSLVEAFENAENFTVGDRNQVTYKLENCVLQKVVTNFNYCKFMGQGEGHRLVTTSVDFREVEAISVSDVRGKFHISFDLDFGGPGTEFIMEDRLLNGEEGGFERFHEKNMAALEETELNSGNTFSNCDRTEAQKSKEMSIALFTDLEPDGWAEMIDLARECRSPKTLEFDNQRSEY